MGVPTKAQIESYSDRLAAIANLNLAGFDTELASATVNHLRQLLNAAGDVAVEDALGLYAAAVDDQSLPRMYPVALPIILGRGAASAFFRQLDGYVQTAGGYANLRAYLADKAAYLHPLAAEIVRAALGQTALTNSNGDITTVFPPAYAARFPDRVYVGADGSLSSETADAVSATTADITLFGSDDHALYVGSRYRFSQLIVALSTLASVDVGLTFQYWNGNAWTSLTVTDSPVGLTKNDRFKWTVPSDWTRYYKDAGGTAFADLTPLYYVRLARTTNTVVTPPVGTCITIVPEMIPTAIGGSSHLGVAQPPLAICRITGANAMVVDPILGVDYARFAEASSLRLRALTPIGADLTVTLAYVDDSGNNDSTAQSAWTAPAALGTKTVALTSTDRLRSVRDTSTISTTATEGIFAIEVTEERTPAL